MSTATKLPNIDGLLFEHIQAIRPEHVTSNAEPHAYASEALGCDRKLGFRLLNVPQSNPIEGGSHFTFWLGDTIHDIVQATVLKNYPAAVKEVPWSLGAVSGRADATYRTPGGLVVAEFKSMAPYSFDLAIGLKKGQEGPRPEHVLQAAMSAVVLEADFLHIVYINKSAPGKSNPVAEWRIKADKEAALFEIQRLTGLVEEATSGILADRVYGEEIIKDPAKTNFPCGYCSWQKACADLPKGRLLKTGDTWKEITEDDVPF